MRRSVNRLPTILVMLLLAAILGACGQSVGHEGMQHHTGDAHATQQIAIRADPSGRLAWERGEYTATAGDTTFTIQNPTNLPHDFAIEGQGMRAQTKIIQGGKSENLTIAGLQPGTYRLACSLPGHRDSGRLATLIVR